MQYLGGKSRIAKQLAAVIDCHRRPGQLVWDAFCGGLSMSVALAKNGPVWSTDACVPLIALYRAVQQGWDPPTNVSLDEYRAAKFLPDMNPLKAFIGFGCSFGGKWFGGFARSNHGQLYAQGCRNVVRRQVRALAYFDALDFVVVEPRPTAALLYLDPPYAGTTGYSGAPPFDNARFAERAREWACHTHVFVSEYSFPIGEVVFEVAKAKTVASGAGGGRVGVERLYHLHPGNV